MILLWLGTLLFVRYTVKWVFHKMSYHRGIWHSVIAAVFSAFATAAAFYWVLKRPEGVAWLAAAFMLVGFFVHLILDEMYSVDVMDTRIKASFGTALKLADFKHWGHSAAMTAAAVLAFLVTPSTKQFTDSMSSQNMWAGLQRRALPADHSVWFGLDVRKLGTQIPALAKRAETNATPTATAPSPAVNPITTGTLPAASGTDPKKAE